MLDGETVSSIGGTGTPGPEGFVELPTNDDGKVTIPFPVPAEQLTQVKVRPPTGTLTGDEIKVTATYTNKDGVKVTKVCIFNNVASNVH